MKITSIQVIRRGQPVTQGAVVGQMVLHARNNPGMAPEVAPGEQVLLNVFDTLKVDVSFEYHGPAQAVTLYGAVGARTLGIFDEYCPGEVSIGLPDSREAFVEVTASLSIEICPISGGTYDLYVKINEYPEAGMPEMSDVLVIEGLYEEVQHTVTPWVYTYEGDSEICTFEFKLTPEQVPGTEWLGDLIVDTFVSQLQAQGSRLLELWVSRDTTPPMWTNYRLNVQATVEPGVAGVANPLPWGAIIIAVLAILFIVAIVWAIKTIDDILFHRKPLSDETKAKFTRDTLVQMVLDLRPETTPATLEEMSDDELRHHLNAILAEEAPPGLGWGAIAIAGGLGIAGLAAAFVLTKRE